MATAASAAVKQLKRQAPPTPVGLRDASVLGQQPY
jgi:hypothetical protein